MSTCKTCGGLHDQRNRWHSLWFYLLAHPEDAAEVARHALYGAPLNTDSFGHVITSAHDSESEPE